MTKELRAALEIIIANLGVQPRKVLEIGSRPATNQEEMCNLRPLFPDSEYVGVDMIKGKGVDVVADAVDLPFPDNTYDLVLCLETMEHAEMPWKVASEIERVSKRNGVVILSSQQNFPIHMHPSDYFRYTPYGLSSLIRSKKESITFSISPPYDDEVKLNPKHVVTIQWNGKVTDKTKLKRAIKNGVDEISGHKPYRHRAQDAWKILRRAVAELGYRQEVAFFEKPVSKDKK